MTRTALLVAATAWLLWPGGKLRAEGTVDYLRDVKPILVHHCQQCHGALDQESGFRLDAVQLIRKGGDSGPAIVPGKADQSVLIEALTGANDRTQMPFDAEPLKPAEIDKIRAWINEGAKAADESFVEDPLDHWSFHRPVRPKLPETAPSNAARVELRPANPIDLFLSAEQDKRGLIRSPQAPKPVLLRRVFLDLIGLPPTPEELRDFLNDESPDAYEKVVDRLLASPHYGERWGRHWMDVWRYSDWSGFKDELRKSARHIWHWRDWIIESINADKGYDRMIVEMLAGDEVAPDNPETLRATGFLARNYFKFNRNVWLEATVEHTSKAFLGMTLNCARCHDHRYDPIPQTAYYQFRAFFEPYQIRTDRVPGIADVLVDGVPRVYDADLDAKTYLFVGGNDKTPDTDETLSPAFPSVLCDKDVHCEPVELPAVAYYPGLLPRIQNETLDAAANQVASTRKRLAVAEAQLKNAQKTPDLAKGKETKRQAADVPPDDPNDGAKDAPQSDDKARDADTGTELVVARLDMNAADTSLSAAQAHLTAVRAVIAADKAKYAVPPASNANDLEQVAAGAQYAEQLLQAEADVAAAELAIARIEQKPKNGKGPKQNVLNAAKKKLDSARTALTSARRAARTDSETYKPLTDVYPKTSTGRRLALARWITSVDNPLTARVAVNHIWLRHFGAALVPTVFEFGNAGQPPTHPKLLDWLAVEFMQSGWSIKHMHRLMVTSEAYRRDSAGVTADHPNAAIDPDNVYYWRMNSRRLEAEIVRDSVLWVGGQLDSTMGGPDLDYNKGLSIPRRSVYFESAYEKQMQFLMLFDAPNVSDCYRRSTSIVPQQALALANSSLSLDQARVLASQISHEIQADPPGDPKAAFVRAAFGHVLSRSPADDELDACSEFLSTQARVFEGNAELTPFDAGKSDPVKPSSDPLQRARENLVHVLLNHHEFVTIR